MPSNTYYRQMTSTPTLIFGSAKDRTSWTVYNASGSVSLFWSNTRFTGGIVRSAFKVPANTAFTLKIPEDDPTKELWLASSGGAIDVYIYEGFGGEK